MADFQNAGTALQIGDGASPEVFTTIAQLMEHGDLGLTRSQLETTKLSSTVGTTKAGLKKVPAMSIGGTYDPADAQVDSLWTKITTDDQEDTNFQLVLSTSPAETWAFQGYISDFMIVGNTPDNLIKFTASLAINSVPTPS